MDFVIIYRDSRHARYRLINEKISSLTDEVLIELYKLDTNDANLTLMPTILLENRIMALAAIVKLGWRPDKEFADVILMMAQIYVDVWSARISAVNSVIFTKTCWALNWLLNNNLTLRICIPAVYMRAIDSTSKRKLALFE